MAELDETNAVTSLSQYTRVANSEREICENLKKINVPSTVPQVAQNATSQHVGAGTYVSGSRDGARVANIVCC